MRLALALSCALAMGAGIGAGLPAQARAQEKEVARWLYAQGAKAYDLGDLVAAIRYFESAYEAERSPEALFMLGQSYRLLNECDRAVFFYRRFLAQRGEASLRAEAERWVAKLGETCGGADYDLTATPIPRFGDEAGEAGGEERAPRWHLQAAGGAGALRVGELGLPLRAMVGLDAAFSFASPFELGLALTALPISFEGVGTVTAASAGLFAGVRLPVLVPELHLRGTVGLGVLTLAGLAEGNPFTDGGAPATGALALPDLRGAVALHYVFGPIFTSLGGAYGFSLPRQGLIGAVQRFEIVAGVGLSL